MQAHVSSILLGVQDLDRSKRFYTEGLGWRGGGEPWPVSWGTPHRSEPGGAAQPHGAPTQVGRSR